MPRRRLGKTRKELTILKKLNFRIWDEWLGLKLDNSYQVDCEITGILESMNYSVSGNRAILKSGRLWIFRRLIKLWKLSGWSSAFDFNHFIEVPDTMRGRVTLSVPLFLFTEVTEKGRKCSFSRNQWHWIRGVWGNTGNIYLPKNGYNLSFRTSCPHLVTRLGKTLRSAGLEFSEREKANHLEIMMRNQEYIVTLFSKLKLYNTSLAIEQRSMIRAMRNRANKLVNCDSSNISRSLEVARKQLEYSEYLKTTGLYEKLPSVLKEMIDVRVDNPSATLSELAANLEKPVSKSTVKYRWSKIKEIIDKSG